MSLAAVYQIISTEMRTNLMNSHPAKNQTASRTYITWIRLLLLKLQQFGTPYLNTYEVEQTQHHDFQHEIWYSIFYVFTERKKNIRLHKLCFTQIFIH